MSLDSSFSLKPYLLKLGGQPMPFTCVLRSNGSWVNLEIRLETCGRGTLYTTLTNIHKNGAGTHSELVDVV